MIAIRTLMLAGAAALACAMPGAAQDLANPRSEFADKIPPQVWIAKIERTERGHRIGNPEASRQLIEFISYTCGHCADFAKQSDGPLDLVGGGPGRIAIEVRPVIRNYLDLVVTMLVQCGDPKGFKDRHRAFLYAQDEWLSKAINAPQSQQAVWVRGDANARANAANALGLNDIVLAQGLTNSQVNACLADNAAARAIMAANNADRTEFEITGTPSFALNGKKLDGVYDWASLSQTLQK